MYIRNVKRDKVHVKGSMYVPGNEYRDIDEVFTVKRVDTPYPRLFPEGKIEVYDENGMIGTVWKSDGRWHSDGVQNPYALWTKTRGRAILQLITKRERGY